MLHVSSVEVSSPQYYVNERKLIARDIVVDTTYKNEMAIL